MEELLRELEEVKQKLTENEERIAEIEKKIIEKKVETGRWKPKEGDKYWFINDIGDICKSTWNNYSIDIMRYAIGNLFETQEECEFAKEKLKVIAELKEFAEPKNRAWNMNNHYFFYYDYRKKKVDTSYNIECKSRRIYFESAEKARQAIVSIGKDRIKKYYLEVEEE